MSHEFSHVEKITSTILPLASNILFTMVFKIQKTKVDKGATAPSQRRFALAHLRTVAWTTSVIGNVHNLLALCIRLSNKQANYSFYRR
jgi:hypothetical protein